MKTHLPKANRKVMSSVSSPWFVSSQTVNILPTPWSVPSQTTQLRVVFLILFLTGISPFVQAQSYEWGNVSLGGGGFVSAIITSNAEEDLIYARTDVGGAYRWDEANKGWIPLLDWVSEEDRGYLGVESLAIDPREPNKLYMLVGTSYFSDGRSAILRSDDYGQTFEITDVSNQFKAHGNGMGRQNGEKLVVDANKPNILYTGTRWNGLFKSTDSGESWNHVSSLDITTTPNENGISFVVLDSLSSEFGTPSQTMFVGASRTGDNLYRSDDGGATYSVISGGPTGLMPQRAVLTNDGNLYITYADGAGPHTHWAVPEPFENGKVMNYNIDTETWTDITPAGFTRAFGGITVDPNSPNRVLVSTINTWMLQDNAYGDRFLLSDDGGASWTDIVARGFDLDDNGYEWINGQSIHWSGSIEFDPFDTKKVWVTSGNGVYTTDDIGASTTVWKFNVNNLEETVPLDLISIPNGPVVSVIGDYDGFVHEDVSQPGIIHKPGVGTTPALAYAALNPKVLLRFGINDTEENAVMYYSMDMGSSWIETKAPGKKGLVAISSDGNTFLCSLSDVAKTFRSEDKGATWNEVSGLGFANVRPVADPVDPNKFYVYNPAGGKVFISTDAGVSFSEIGNAGSGGSKIIRPVLGHEGHLWIALYGGGLTHSTDSGENFTKLANVSYCGAVGLGKAGPQSDYSTIFIWGTVNDGIGLYRSTDKGTTWTKINDDAHQFGGPANGQFVVGDKNVFGRVYMSTAGRGIIFGEADDTCIPTFVQPLMQVGNGSLTSDTYVAVADGESVILSPEPTVNGTWSWSGPNGFLSDSREVMLENIQEVEAGTYTATYTNTEGCQSAGQTFTVLVDDEEEVVTGIGDEGNSNMMIYPNPSAGDLTIQFHETKGKKIQIASVSGRVVYQKDITAADRSIFLRTQLPAGVYIVQVKSDSEILTKKIIIK